MARTIAAPATPPGQGGVGIVRISGPEALAVLEKVFRPQKGGYPLVARRMTYGRVADEKGLVDEALAVYFPAPHSYTGEDVCEIQCHGGSVAVRRVLERCLSNGAALAQPGEFTKRAFLNGRMDLSQAEAVMDLIGAQSERALSQAADQLSGRLRGEIEAMQDALTDLMAQLEVALDYPEEDVEEETLSGAAARIGLLREQGGALLAQFSQGRLLREGARVAIVGRPNAGKSSLLNALLEADRAIVTDIPGTTRDTLEETLILNGLPIHLVDTAGLRQQGDAVERIGIARARAELEQSDLALWVVDGSQRAGEEDRQLAEALRDKAVLILANKQDLERQFDIALLEQWLPQAEVLAISALTGAGLEQVKERIFARLTGGNWEEAGGARLTNARQAAAMAQALAALERAEDSARSEQSPDFVEIDLRDAFTALGEITGHTLHEQIIDRIFEKFCLGK